MKIFLFGIGLLFFSLFSTKLQSNETHQIRFYKIDNQVKVFINDKKVYESEVIDGNPELDIRVNIEEFLVKGYNLVKVELYNGSQLNAYKSDTNWEIRYEILKGEESIDYMHQASAEGKKGFSIDFQHDIVVY